MKGPKVRIEEFEVTGEKLLATVKELVHQGNVRRVVIRNAKGVTLLEIPLVLGIAGAVLVPVWAAIGALAEPVRPSALVPWVVMAQLLTPKEGSGPPSSVSVTSSRRVSPVLVTV